MIINKEFTLSEIDERGLHNKYVDYEATERALDELMNGSFKAEREIQPRTQKMRLRWNRKTQPTMEWRSDLNHGRWKMYHAIRNYISSRVGQPFAQVYSDFLKNSKYSRMTICRFETPAQVFEGLFTNINRNPADQIVRHEEFMIDADGLIRRDPNNYKFRRSRNHRLRKPMENWEKVVTPKTHMLNAYAKQWTEVIGHKMFSDVMCAPTTSYLERVQTVFQMTPRDTLAELFPNIGTKWGRQLDLFRTIWDVFFDTDYKNMYYNAEPYTKEWYIAKAQQKKDRARAKKTKKTGNPEYYDYVLYLDNNKNKVKEVGFINCIRYGSIEAARQALTPKDKGRWDYERFYNRLLD